VWRPTIAAVFGQHVDRLTAEAQAAGNIARVQKLKTAINDSRELLEIIQTDPLATATLAAATAAREVNPATFSCNTDLLGSSIRAGNGAGVGRRELPKEVTNKLKQWIFEHIEHPYPTEAEKFQLMKDTAMDLQQLDNWVINARVRIWRPMVCSVFFECLDAWMAKAKAEGDDHTETKLTSARSNHHMQVDMVLGDAEATATLKEKAAESTAALYDSSVRTRRYTQPPRKPQPPKRKKDTQSAEDGEWEPQKRRRKATVSEDGESSGTE